MKFASLPPSRCGLGNIAVIVLLAAPLGCGGDSSLHSPTALKMKGLANAYLDHVVGANGSPRDEAAFKKHIKGLRASVQYDYKIDPDNIDGFFVSERDNQPFVVLYGEDVGKISADSKKVIAYEKTGQNGKRLIVFAGTKVDLVSESELEQLKSAKGRN